MQASSSLHFYVFAPSHCIYVPNSFRIIFRAVQYTSVALRRVPRR